MKKLKYTLLHILAPQLFLPCGAFRCGNPVDGEDYGCEYDENGDIFCEDCVCSQYGYIDPRSGKKIRFLARFIKMRGIRNLYRENEGC